MAKFPSPTFISGDLIAGRYRIEGVLGQGGYGVVYRATQVAMGRPVALKLLRSRLFEQPDALQRFQREAEIARRLEHPNTVRIYDFGADAGTAYIAYEILRGRTFADAIKAEGRLPPARVGHIASQVLRSLMEAHALGIIHRDIKPANIFLCDLEGAPDFVKVLDLGIAKANLPPGQTWQALTQMGEMLGTPHYMAPEQACGHPVTPAVDLYALGISMSQALTGQPVFRGTAMEICTQQISASPVPHDPEVLRGILGPVIQRATQKDPASRYTSAAEMLQHLDAARSSRDSAPASMNGTLPVMPPPSARPGAAASPPISAPPPPTSIAASPPAARSSAPPPSAPMAPPSAPLAIPLPSAPSARISAPPFSGPMAPPSAPLAIPPPSPPSGRISALPRSASNSMPVGMPTPPAPSAAFGVTAGGSYSPYPPPPFSPAPAPPRARSARVIAGAAFAILLVAAGGAAVMLLSPASEPSGGEASRSQPPSTPVNQALQQPSASPTAVEKGSPGATPGGGTSKPGKVSGGSAAATPPPNTAGASASSPLLETFGDIGSSASSASAAPGSAVKFENAAAIAAMDAAYPQTRLCYKGKPMAISVTIAFFPTGAVHNVQLAGALPSSGEAACIRSRFFNTKMKPFDYPALATATKQYTY
jgi:serine/threonine-protein kinase